MRTGEKTKAKIKRAAMELFVKKGVNGCGVREIAKASGITEGAIYRHFSGKEDLVWQVFAENFEHYADALNDLQKAETTTAAKIEAMVQGFCRFFDEDQTLFRFLLLVQHGQLDKVTEDMASPVETVLKVIQSGIDQGDILHPDATEATAWVMGIVLQSASFQIDGRLDGDMTARAPSLSGACLDALGV